MIADEPEKPVKDKNGQSVSARGKKHADAAGRTDGKPVGGKIQGAQ